MPELRTEDAEQTVRLDIADGVARLTLDRPSVKNALRPAEWQQLRSHATTIRGDGSVRVVVVRGAGDAFSAGGDLKTMPERLALPHDARRAQLARDGESLLALRGLGLPLVALIDGACSGAGLALALLADLRVATTRARFAAPFLQVGLTSDFATRYLLERAIGRSAAQAMLLLGTVHDGVAAAGLGLVHQVVADEAALGVAGDAITARLLTAPPVALAKMIRAPYDEAELARQLAADALAQADCSVTADAKEGVAAFLEKRLARFTGR